MTRDEIYLALTVIFHDVFDDPRIKLFDAMTAKDLAGWDSLNHINLIIAVEQKYKIRFNTTEVARLANVGEFIDAILRKSMPPS